MLSGSHSDELKGRVTHLAVAIGHVHLAIFLSKSPLRALWLDYSVIKGQTEKQNAQITTLKIIPLCTPKRSVHFFLPYHFSVMMMKENKLQHYLFSFLTGMEHVVLEVKFFPQNTAIAQFEGTGKRE